MGDPCGILFLVATRDRERHTKTKRSHRLKLNKMRTTLFLEN